MEESIVRRDGAEERPDGTGDVPACGKTGVLRAPLEEQKGLFRDIQAAFDLGEMDLRTYSPLTLAFLGDDVYDLVIRSLIVGRENVRPNRLHAHASHLVKAETQATLMDALEQMLTDEEADWYRRGKNAKSPTTAKNASTEDYRKATGCETLLGWLYLTGQEDRLLELIREGLNAIAAPEAEKRQI